MRRIDLPLLFLTSLQLWAQQDYRVHVTDEATGEPLSHVIVSSSGGGKIMGNQNGFFICRAEKKEVIQISCIGYNTLSLRAQDLADSIVLSPLKISDYAVSAQHVINRVSTRADKDYWKYGDDCRSFLYQMLLRHGEWVELNEACIEACPSVNLRELRLYGGRRLRNESPTKDYPSVGALNLHQLIVGGPITYESTFWQSIRKPFTIHKAKDNRYKRYSEARSLRTAAFDDVWYDAEVRTLIDSNGHKIYRLTFIPEPEYPGPILEGTMYVDGKTFRMLAFEGTLHNFSLELEVDRKLWSGQVDPTIRITYMQERGYTEIESVVANFKIGHVTCHSTLLNLRNRKISFDSPFAFNPPIKDDIVAVLNKMGTIKSDFWDNEIIQHTEEEEKLIRGMVDYNK